ncbi:MAG TPA: MBL fold metallo-hydrolase [Limnochordales bacterium]
MQGQAPPRTFAAADGVVGLDLLFQGRPEAIAAFCLMGPGGRFVLIECGPESTYEGLVAALDEAGLRLDGLVALLVTHIHLDHAGAAGRIATEAGCPVYVHPAGLEHLAEPSRLWASASRVFGDAMVPLWKSITPVPREQLRPLEDGQRLRFFGRTVEALHTPGHASHHVAFRLDGDVVVAGDLAGVRLPGMRYVRAPAMPPELQVETWLESLERVRRLRPSRLLLTHFGPVAEEVDDHLQRVGAQLGRWSEAVLQGIREGLDDAAIMRRLEALEDQEMGGELDGARARAMMELVTPLLPMTQGYRRYWTRHHPERLARSG